MSAGSMPLGEQGQASPGEEQMFPSSCLVLISPGGRGGSAGALPLGVQPESGCKWPPAWSRGLSSWGRG